ncbi:hypothetical protein BFD53_02220 [Escherichia coli]|nr:hypothetical protein BFD53_02220 [Escherichia coli]
MTEFALEIMRIIIELPRLNENHKSLANIVNKNVAQLTFTTARPLEHRNIVQVPRQKLQICSNYFDWHYLLIRRRHESTPYYIRH